MLSYAMPYRVSLDTAHKSLLDSGLWMNEHCEYQVAATTFQNESSLSQVIISVRKKQSSTGKPELLGEQLIL